MRAHLKIRPYMAANYTGFTFKALQFLPAIHEIAAPSGFAGMARNDLRGPPAAPAESPLFSLTIFPAGATLET
jgi:hypothetical protein